MKKLSEINQECLVAWRNENKKSNPIGCYEFMHAFYRQVIEEMLEGVVSKDRQIPDPIVTREMMVSEEAYQAFLSRLEGSNQAKAETRQRIKEIME